MTEPITGEIIMGGDADPLDMLKEDYDRLVALLGEVESETPREQKIAAVATAAQAGEPLPDLWENVSARQLKADGVARAIDLAIRQIGDQIARGRERKVEFSSLRTISLAHTLTADQVVSEIVAAFKASDRAAKAATDRAAQRRFREDAKAEYDRQRGEYRRSHPEDDWIGFQAHLSDEQWSALNPPGSGGFGVSGRTIGDATVGA